MDLYGPVNDKTTFRETFVYQLKRNKSNYRKSRVSIHENVSLSAVIRRLAELSRIQKVTNSGLVPGEHLVLGATTKLNELHKNMQVAQEIDHIARIMAQLECLLESEII